MTRKTKLVILIFSIFTLFVLAGILTKAVSSFFDSNRLVFNRPVEVKLTAPIKIEARVPEVVKETLILDYPEEVDTPIEKYICEKWGPYDCRTALAIAKAESGLREDAININTNDTIDVGVFQINSVHFKKPGCSLKEIVNAEKNIDCAYSIWKAQHWQPWVAFLNSSFKKHL